MWRPENLKKSPTFFWNNILSTVKTKCEIFSIGYSQNIWTLKREKKNLLCQQLNFIFYEKSKRFFLRYVLLFKRTFMKHFLLQNELQKEIGSFFWLFNLSKRVLAENAATTTRFWLVLLNLHLSSERHWEDGCRKSEYGIGTRNVFFMLLNIAWIYRFDELFKTCRWMIWKSGLVKKFPLGLS